MYNEVIYTHCGKGISNLVSNSVVTGEGWKVYSRSAELYSDGTVRDVSLIDNLVKFKVSDTKNEIAEDAYIYVCPDTGFPIFMNVHPISNSELLQLPQNHDRRGGKFITQALIGDFSQLYPCETFGDSTIWNAQLRGVDYYYDTPAGSIPQRSIVAQSKNLFNETGSFIKDGRGDALKSAVAFVISQMALPAEQRRYIVIKDTADNIEHWIAAIGYAFSAELTSKISFITRIDKLGSNAYAINKASGMRVERNAQDSNQSSRLFGLLVGADIRMNITLSAQPNVPYVVLDGTQKRAMFESEIKSGYFNAISGFDESHSRFIHEFLPSFDNIRHSDVIALYGAFYCFENAQKTNASTLGKALSIIGKLTIRKTDIIRIVITDLKENLSKYLEENVADGIAIANWLVNNTRLAGITNDSIEDAVCDSFLDCLYLDNKFSITPIEYYDLLKGTAFLENVSKAVIDRKCFNNHIESRKLFKTKDTAAFCRVFLQCANQTGSTDNEFISSVIKLTVEECFDSKNTELLRVILSESARDANAVKTRLFPILKSNNKELADYVLSYITKDGNFFKSDNDVFGFCGDLFEEGYSQIIPQIIANHITKINDLSGAMAFIEAMDKLKWADNAVRAAAYEGADDKIPLDKKFYNQAKQIQNGLPQGAKCPHSALVSLLADVLDKKKRGSLLTLFKQYREQGLPYPGTTEYIKQLIDSLIQAELNVEETTTALALLKGNQSAYFSEYAKGAVNGISHYSGGFTSLVEVAAGAGGTGGELLRGKIIEALSEIKLTNKLLDPVTEGLSKKAISVLQNMIDDAEELEKQRKADSRGGIFGLFKGKK